MKIIDNYVQSVGWRDGLLTLSLRALAEDVHAEDSMDFVLRARRGLASRRAETVVATHLDGGGERREIDVVVEVDVASAPGGIWDAWLEARGSEGLCDSRVETKRRNSSYDLLRNLATGVREIRPYDTADCQLSVLVGRQELGGVLLNRIDWDEDVLVVNAEVESSLYGSKKQLLV